MPEIIGFVGSSHANRSPNFDAQRCINLMPMISSSGTSKTKSKLVSTPGLVQIADRTSDGASCVRGMFVFDEQTLFVAIGKYMYRFFSDASFIQVGEIDDNTTPVNMSGNGTTVFVACGARGFVVYPNLNVLLEYIGGAFLGATGVGFINGSFVFNEPGSSRFWVMDPYSLVLNPLWFATAEGAPDGLLTLAVNHQEIWLFGASTVEVWAGNGSADFPYSRIAGVYIEQGLAATYSVARINSSLFWLSANDQGQGMIFKTSGYQLTRISDDDIEASIATYSVISDAVAYAYQQEGHSFYVLSFPTQNITWVYDDTTGTWHQRGWREASGQIGRHRSNCHAFFARRNLVGDWQNGKIYILDTQVYSDNGNPLVRLRSSPHISADLRRVPHTSIQFDIETGLGLQQGQGSDPQAMLRWSDDGGHTWSNQKYCSLGTAGKYKRRVRFTRLGQARDRVYELSVADPVSFTILGAVINAE